MNSSVEQCAVARRAIIGHGPLEHVTDVVEFVAPALYLGFHALLAVVSNVIGIQISAGLLNRDNFLNDLVSHRLQVRTIAGLQREAHSLRPLVDVRVRIDRTALWSVA